MKLCGTQRCLSYNIHIGNQWIHITKDQGCGEFVFLLLTHWGRDKMDAMSQTIFSNAFSWMKMLQLRLKFHWSLFPRDQLTIFHHWFRLWLGAVQATSHYLNQWWSVYRRIYASLGLNELTWTNCWVTKESVSLVAGDLRSHNARVTS